MATNGPLTIILSMSFFSEGAEPMSGRIAKLAVGSLILALSAACSNAGPEAMSARTMFDTSYTASLSANLVYKHNNNFLITIALNNFDPSVYKFPQDSSKLLTSSVKFNNTNPTWPIKAARASSDGKRLYLHLQAKHPNADAYDPTAYQANGTGTIYISIVDTTTGNIVTTTATCPVEPTDPSLPVY